MDPARSLGGGGPRAHCPRPGLLCVRGEERTKAEQLVAGPHETVEPRRLEPEVGEELALVFGFEPGHLRLDGRADRQHPRVLRRRGGADRLDPGVVLEAVVLPDVGDEHHRLRGEEGELAQHAAGRGVEGEGPGRVAVSEVPCDAVDDGLALPRFASPRLRALLRPREGALDGVEVGKHQLRVDRLDVRDGVHPSRDMGDAIGLEAAHHVCDRIHFADVSKEAVPEPLAPRRAGHESRDVDEGQGRRDHPRGAHDGGEGVEAGVGNRHHPDVGLDGAEGIALGRHRGPGEGVEQGGLAGVRQPDDAASETHRCPAGRRRAIRPRGGRAARTARAERGRLGRRGRRGPRNRPTRAAHPASPPSLASAPGRHPPRPAPFPVWCAGPS